MLYLGARAHFGVPAETTTYNFDAAHDNLVIGTCEVDNKRAFDVMN
jgi:hypothetical protein